MAKMAKYIHPSVEEVRSNRNQAVIKLKNIYSVMKLGDKQVEIDIFRKHNIFCKELKKKNQGDVVTWVIVTIIKAEISPKS